MLTDVTVAGCPPGLFKTTFPVIAAPPAPPAASVLVATTVKVAAGPEPKVTLAGDTVVVTDQVGAPAAAVWAWRLLRVAMMLGLEQPVAVIVIGVCRGATGVEPGSVGVMVVISVACNKLAAD